jgi:hypothetical protein
MSDGSMGEEPIGGSIDERPTSEGSMSDGREHSGAEATQDGPSEEEMRAAYEAELNRITSAEMILQTAVSLLNIGGRRLGLAPPASPGDAPSDAAGERDLEQVRDAIDGASALLPILERRMPRELGPLRDAVAQLQVAYAREAKGGASAAPATPQAPPSGPLKPVEGQEPAAKPGAEDDRQKGPGPAQTSGRLWVPGR